MNDEARIDRCPTCDTCGTPITTGAMAILCPRRERCEFWPAEGLQEPFDSWSREVAAERDAGSGSAALPESTHE